MAPGASLPPAASMPVPRTRLIGRAAERAAARGWLLAEAVPVLTLAGTGGVGKTRLALEIAAGVAEAFADGVVWVDLSALTDPALTPIMVAVALEARLTPDRPAEQTVVEHLRSRQLLLLLDNCEHLLVAAAELVAMILASCPAVQILATSRARLRVRGEQVLTVDPLPLPEDDYSGLTTATASEAVRLFSERARAADAGFALTEENAAAVAALCRRLDGLPLAIELTAARVAGLPPEALLGRMTNPLPPARSGPRDLPPRQQTMRDTIAWSYELLDADARALFCRLSVFVGGFTLHAVEAIRAQEQDASHEPEPGALASFEPLLEYHLVRRDPTAGNADPRYTMLETVREFGLERLVASGEEAEIRTRHARYFLSLVDVLNAKVAPHLPEAAEVFAKLNREYPNLRAALGWLVKNRLAEEAVSLAGWLHAFWFHFGYTREGRQWLEQVLAMEGDVSPAARVWVLVGLFGVHLPEPAGSARAAALIEEAVVVARDSGDPLSIGLAAEWRAVRCEWDGDLDGSERLTHEARAAFARLPPEPWTIRNLTILDQGLGELALLRGDIPAAEAILLAVLERQRALEADHGAPYGYVNRTQTCLGHAARARGDEALALDRYQGALRDAVSAGEVRGVINALGGVAATLAGVGRWAEAARLFGATEAVCERTGFGFEATVLDWQSAMGLPRPWQQETPPVLTARLRKSIGGHSSRSLPPLPNPAAGALFWAEGRSASTEEAIASASAVCFDVPAPAPTREAPPILPSTDRFGLSPREREVLGLLCQRLSDAEIGEALCISPRTASSHVAHIYDKLGVGSRREAAALAARHELAWSPAGVPTEAAP